MDGEAFTVQLVQPSDQSEIPSAGWCFVLLVLSSCFEQKLKDLFSKFAEINNNNNPFAFSAYHDQCLPVTALTPLFQDLSPAPLRSTSTAAEQHSAFVFSPVTILFTAFFYQRRSFFVQAAE